MTDLHILLIGLANLIVLAGYVFVIERVRG
jgi:hypothetical protein